MAPVRAGGGGNGGKAGCAKQWNVGTIGTTANRTATVEGGALVLRSSNSQLDNLLNVTHRAALAGDFQASFQFEMFVSGGAAPSCRPRSRRTSPIQPRASPPRASATSEQGATVPGISATFQPGSSESPAGDLGWRDLHLPAHRRIRHCDHPGWRRDGDRDRCELRDVRCRNRRPDGRQHGRPDRPRVFHHVPVFHGDGWRPGAMPDDFGCDSLQPQ